MNRRQSTVDAPIDQEHASVKGDDTPTKTVEEFGSRNVESPNGNDNATHGGGRRERS